MRNGPFFYFTKRAYSLSSQQMPPGSCVGMPYSRWIAWMESLLGTLEDHEETRDDDFQGYRTAMRTMEELRVIDHADFRYHTTRNDLRTYIFNERLPEEFATDSIESIQFQIRER